MQGIEDTDEEIRDAEELQEAVVEIVPRVPDEHKDSERDDNIEKLGEVMKQDRAEAAEQIEDDKHERRDEDGNAGERGMSALQC